MFGSQGKEIWKKKRKNNPGALLMLFVSLLT